MNNYYLSEENKNMTGYASKDRPWLKFYPPGASKIEDINLTYYQYYIEANKKFLDKLNKDIQKYEGTVGTEPSSGCAFFAASLYYLNARENILIQTLNERRDN